MAVNEQIENQLKTIGLPLAYRKFKAFKNNPVPKPPYLVYFIDSESGSGADGKNLLMRKHVTVELYSDTKSISLEAAVEAALFKCEFDKYEEYIEEEKMYCVSYEFDIYEKIRRN